MTGTAQLQSLPFSLISLVVASTRLFYSQRLGIFSDHAPCLKMMARALFLNFLLILGPLFTLIIVASYFHLYVMVPVIITWFSNWIIMSQIYCTKAKEDEIIEKFYGNYREHGIKETRKIFYQAVFTSYISPCTVWANNSLMKTKFLLTSFLIIFATHFWTIIINFSLLKFTQVIRADDFPPVFHCFGSNSVTLPYELVHIRDGLMVISDTSTYTKKRIRFCGPDEQPTDFFFKWILTTGMIFNLISLLAAACLQILGDYSKQKLLCPRMFYHKLNEIFSKCSSNEDGKALEDLSQTIEQIVKLENAELKEKDLIEHILRVCRNDENYPDPKIFKLMNKNYHLSFAASIQNFTNRIRGDRAKQDILIEIKRQISYYSNGIASVWNFKTEPKIAGDSASNTGSSSERERSVQSKVLTNLPPMHWAAEEGNLGLWCFFSLIGGEAGARNGQETSSINVILKSKDWSKSCSHLTKWWITRASRKYGKDAVANAVKLNDSYLLEILLENGYGKLQSSAKAATPVHLAAELGHDDVLRMLLDHQHEVNSRDHMGRTPLHMAVENKHIICVKTLIHYGADVTSRDTSYRTPIHYETWGKNECSVHDSRKWTPLHMTARNGELECLEILLGKGADINSRDTNGRTPLHLALESGDKNIIKTLIFHGADVTARDNLAKSSIHHQAWGIEECNVVTKTGRTPLHLTVVAGDAECLNMLLDKGAPVNVKDLDGRTPLHMAAARGQADCLKVLLEKGALITGGGELGNTPLHIATEEGKVECLETLIAKVTEIDAKNLLGETPLHVAASTGKVNCLKALLRNGADANAMNVHGNTPLHLAAAVGEVQCLKLLLLKGARVNASNGGGATPLHRAASRETKDCLQILIKNGAMVNGKDFNGSTPLHLAARFGKTESTAILLANGAAVNGKDCYGNTPLSCAIELGAEMMSTALVRHEARV